MRAMLIFQYFTPCARRKTAIALAVGVVVGAPFTTIVNLWVKDMINPPLGLLLGGIDFSNFFVVLKGAGTYPTLKAAQDAGAVNLSYGVFFNSVINFLIVPFAGFFLVPQLNRLIKHPPAAGTPP